MSTLPPFKPCIKLTMGVELELQLVNLQDFDLAMEAKDLLRRLEAVEHPGEIKPEITQSMIEINSSIQTNYNSLLEELIFLRNVLVKEANQTHIGVCGGGAHPFQKWKEQRIYETERFASLSEQYGYLAKQFTVFGQHVHIACASGDEALYLCHAIARYIPHFIALAASSPYHQGIDTAFDCSRLTVISAFPLSGTPPWLHSWDQFSDYYKKMANLGIVKSMKDFYWDIRPKPEYGTVELRICDTPLTVKEAAVIAAYLQTLVYYLIDHKNELSRDIYLTYITNRFRAARYGLEAIVIDPIQQLQIPIADDIIQNIMRLIPYAEKLGNVEALEYIKELVDRRQNGAAWLRQCYAKQQSLNDVVRSQTELWMNELI